MDTVLDALNRFMGGTLDGGPLSWVLTLAAIGLLLAGRMRSRR